MDYESKYNELVEVARSVVEGNPGLCNMNKRLGRLRDLLLEKESEDERIRKEIIECIETLIKAPGANPRLCDWLAYLEKQKDEAQKQFNLGIQAGREEVMYEMEKERKPANEKEYIRILKGLVADFVRDKQPKDVVLYQRIFDYLDGISVEQKPAKKDEIGYDLGREKGMDAGIEYVLNHLELYGLCKPAEWSEEDELMRKMCIADLGYLTEYEPQYKERYDAQIEWLKSLPERFNLQPKQEWSEEDEIMLNSFMHKIEVCNLLSNKEDVWITRKLKSLRPQPHWKPSEEQMHYLLAVINEPNNAGSESCHLVLKGLYEDLKKLM